jgi:acetyl-CoA carboxylase biotin carboxyl carrier protein
MELAEILALLQAVRDTGVSELDLAHGDFKLTIRQQPAAAPAAQVAALVPAPVPLQSTVSAAVVETNAVAEGPLATAMPKAITVNSPMVGTFYRSPSPDAPPFVDAGDLVKTGQTVCIIEAMKLMNELESDVSGRVVRFLVQNGDPVEFGQPLIELEPV